MDILERLCEIISERFDIEKSSIGEDTTFSELDIDSIDLVDLVMVVEDEYGIEISDEALENVSSVGEVAALVESLV